MKHLIMESLADFTAKQHLPRMAGRLTGELLLVWVEIKKCWRVEREPLDRATSLESPMVEVSDIGYDSLRTAMVEAIAENPAVICLATGVVGVADLQRLASDEPQLQSYLEDGGRLMIGAMNVGDDIIGRGD